MSDQQAYNMLQSAWSYLLYTNYNEPVEALDILERVKADVLISSRSFVRVMTAYNRAKKWEYIGKLCKQYTNDAHKEW